MGTGIAAAIPIILGPNRHGWRTAIERKYFTDKFFENYTVDDEGKIYTIKPEVLLENYKSFLAEFYDCIGEEYEAEKISYVKTYDEFEAVFNYDTRNARRPFIYKHGSMFSFLGGESDKYWLFYSGSYKAYLETYCTLTHIERLLAKAINNPLAQCVKFGIFG